LLKKISYFIYLILFSFNFILNKVTKKNFLIYLRDFIENNSYTQYSILNKKIIFFTPSPLIKWLSDSFLQKEPETIEWINSFNNKTILWDIGANIGLYSIYAATKHKNIQIICFEPSTNNLRVLSRNISINNLEEKITINQFPLTNKINKYLLMKENQFIEGSALSSFGENFNHSGKRMTSKNQYKIYGTTVDYLLKNKILDFPNYIKIDVDGLEHIILDGAKKSLINKKIRSISIEINENFKSQYNKILKIMKKNNFVLKHKKRNSFFYQNKQFAKTYNYIFSRN
jgi:FkbM family methyltransferase